MKIRKLSSVTPRDRWCHSGEARAEAFVGRVVRACEALATFPERGTRRDDIRANLRTMGFERCATIAFAVNGETVAIHGIFYGGQDFEAVLRGADGD